MKLKIELENRYHGFAGSSIQITASLEDQIPFGGGEALLDNNNKEFVRFREILREVEKMCRKFNEEDQKAFQDQYLLLGGKKSSFSLFKKRNKSNHVGKDGKDPVEPPSQS